MKKKLRIPSEVIDEINAFMTAPDNPVIDAVLEIVEKYGGADEINRKAQDAWKLETQMERLRAARSRYVADLEWLMTERDRGAFISIPEYRRKILGQKAVQRRFDEGFAVTLEISSLSFFPWIIAEARQAIEKQEVMPGRYIRVRFMKEQEADHDLVACGAAMNIIGASIVETLDTKGTDGSNVHLGGPDTITGYFGGIGQPNDHGLRWVDEYLYYYTHYGVRQVLNINPGTVLLGYLLHRLGILNEFKISVFMGNDNPYSVLWTLMTARLFSGRDGSTPLTGFNFSNSVDNQTIELSARIRSDFGFEDRVRFEHHILETWRAIVKQPYDRRDELLEIAWKVKNISAKHEGGDVKVEQKRDHPSSVLDYFVSKEEILRQGLMPALERNFLDKHDAANATAQALTRQGLAFIAAKNLH